MKKINILVFFSILFYGYIFSGLYFSYYENINTAKFFNFSGNFNTQDMKESLFQVVLGYLFFITGYKFGNKIKIMKINFEVFNIDFNSKYLYVFLIILFFISFMYWIHVSFIDLLFNMGQYVLFQSLNPISTAPYILGYISTYYLFLLNLKNNNTLLI